MPAAVPLHAGPICFSLLLLTARRPGDEQKRSQTARLSPGRDINSREIAGGPGSAGSGHARLTWKATQRKRGFLKFNHRGWQCSSTKSCQSMEELRRRDLQRGEPRSVSTVTFRLRPEPGAGMPATPNGPAQAHAGANKRWRQGAGPGPSPIVRHAPTGSRNAPHTRCPLETRLGPIRHALGPGPLLPAPADQAVPARPRATAAAIERGPLYAAAFEINFRAHVASGMITQRQ